MLVLMAFHEVGQPLRAPSGHPPWGIDDGILALQLAGDSTTVRSITDGWEAEHFLRAGFLLGLDYLFAVAYAIFVALACLWSASILRRRIRSLGWIGRMLAWAVLGAALLDAAENVMLLHQLLHGPAFPWPEITRSVALVKFLLVGAAVGYSLAGLVVWCFSANARPMEPAD